MSVCLYSSHLWKKQKKNKNHGKWSFIPQLSFIIHLGGYARRFKPILCFFRIFVIHLSKNSIVSIWNFWCLCRVNKIPWWKKIIENWFKSAKEKWSVELEKGRQSEDRKIYSSFMKRFDNLVGSFVCWKMGIFKSIKQWVLILINFMLWFLTNSLSA